MVQAKTSEYNTTMSDDQFDDLKQFITGVVSQSEKRLLNDLGGRIDGVEGRLGRVETRLDSLETKVDDGLATIGETIVENHDVIDNQERRITKLEAKTA
jgi:hypothetical protein